MGDIREMMEAFEQKRAQDKSGRQLYVGWLDFAEKKRIEEEEEWKREQEKIALEKEKVKLFKLQEKERKLRVREAMLRKKEEKKKNARRKRERTMFPKKKSNAKLGTKS